MASAEIDSVMEVENRYARRKNDETESSTAPAWGSMNSNAAAVVYSPELLQMYYARLFPFSMLHSWLSYENQQTFSRREFSFTIEPVPGEEIYIRYQSFSSESELSQAILKRRPTKIDLGAVFSHPPKDHNTVQKASFRPEQRELVFDIDLTDYDEIRKCGCSGANICGICWGFMKMAVKVMDEGLREDFGFEDIAWFYSGRRGVHAWVCDERARELTDQGRSAVASYFEINLASENNKDVHLPYPLHPMLARAYAVLEPMFIEQIIPASGHGLLASTEQWSLLLESLPEAADPVREKLTEEWGKPRDKSTPIEKWEQLKMHLKVFIKGTGKSGLGKAAKSMSSKDRSRLENWTAEVVFRYTYPRLDVNVSKMRNHLLKSPFCVHPKTGRVCVPIEADQIDHFDPFSVPTLPQLVDELDNYMADENDNNVQDWQKTSLKEYFEPFQKQFIIPLLKKMRKQERDAKEQQAARTADF